MTKIDPKAPVLVTGATGYVASWIVKYLLEDGRTVRATVRDPQRATGLEHLHELAAAHPGRLTLHRADLLEAGSYTEAMAGCELVIHTASPFLVGKVNDPYEDLVRPALDGTSNVLDSVDATESVRRVVLTSSVAALYGDAIDMVGKETFTESDWNTTSSLDRQPYSYSKTVAEQEAWKRQGAQQRWDLVTIHPGLVFGPSLTPASKSGSMAALKTFTDFSQSLGTPRLWMGVVDVREAARAHVTAGFTPSATGRYVLTADSVRFLQIGRVLRRAFGNRLTFPRWEAPKMGVWLAAPVAGQTRDFIARNVGYPVAFDNTRTVAELGISFRPWQESVAEHFQQMVDDGLVRA